MKKISDINITNKCFSNMLPRVELPFEGESLIGYIFRLAFINDFAPSSIIKEIVDPEVLKKYIKSEDLEFLELNLDISRLSSMIQIPVELLQNLMITKIRKRVYKYNCSKTKKLLKFGNLKICPICIREWRIPSIFLLYEFRECPWHRMPLINECSCGRKINFFKQSNILVCSNRKCGKKITEMFDYEVLPYSESEMYKYAIINDYINSGVPFVKSGEKVFKGINKRLNYLTSFYREAAKHVFCTLPICRFIRLVRFFNVSEDLFYFSSIVYLLNKFKLTPYQFQNIYIPNNPNFIINIKKFDYFSNGTKIEVSKFPDVSDINKLLKTGFKNIEILGQVEVKSDNLIVDFDFKIFNQNARFSGSTFIFDIY